MQYILMALRNGAPESARRIRQVESDKTRIYPEIEAQLYKMFGCVLHGTFGCTYWLCEKPPTKEDKP